MIKKSTIKRREQVYNWIENNLELAGEFHSEELFDKLRDDNIYSESTREYDIVKGYNEHYHRWRQLKNNY